MARQVGNTTVREESLAETIPARLVLEWVWPRSLRVPLAGARLGIGRDESSALLLDGSGVSRHHAELYRQGPLYVLRDLGSTNGSWLGGKRVEHAPVSPGDVLRIGDWVGVFAQQKPDAPAFGELAPGLFGGPEMAELVTPLRRAATASVPVALVGRTGSGKERLAHAVHHLSGRTGPFVAVNCAALPDQLAEAELFGYRRGAFTGAERASTGYFRAADRGTLFLDEMPELSAAVQAKLLRVLEDGHVVGLGETSGSTVDVRIVSASQTSLSQLVSDGWLRQDLVARLSGIELEIPALSARRADVAALFSQFLKQQTGGRPPAVSPRLVEALCLHDWPENVRELELVTRRLLALHGHEPTLHRRHLPEKLSALTDALSANPSAPSAPRSRVQHDLTRLERELATNGGNIKAAAEALGISRQRVYRLLEGRDRGDGDTRARH